MFTYAHFRSDLLPVSVGTTDGDGNVEFSRSRMDGSVFVDEFEVTLNEFSSTFRVSWNATTYPRSVTSYAQSTFQSTVSTDGGAGGETVGSAALAEYSTGVDSHTFTAPATQTHSFTTQYFSNTATTLSASATATTTTTGSRTLTMTGVTTRVPAALPDSFNETRWFVARELPFGSSPSGLRRVGLAYGIGTVGGSTGSRTVASLLTGAQTYNSTRFVSTSSSSTNTNFSDDTATSYSTKYIRKTVYETSAMGAGQATARRRRYDGSAAFGLNGTSEGAMSWDGDQMISPTVAPAFSPFVSIASNVLSRRIFTEIESATDTSRYSIGGSSAMLAWSYLSSSWRLLATKTNDSASTTIEISLLTSASAATTTAAATTAVGLTTAILGPLLPFSASSFRDISVTQSASINTSRTFVMMSGSGTSGTAASASSAHAASTSFSFSDGTTNSNLAFYASAPAISVSTSSTRFFDVFAYDVTIYQNSKWNEASRGDAVSVIE